MELQKIIQQLDKKSYSLLINQFRENKADKFSFLLSSYRLKTANDEKLLRKLEITPSAFYTLKSRLAVKTQDFLYKNTNETRIQLLQNVANVEHLVYKTPRETAIGVLKKLESELIKVDMPNELIIVYRALKKLHLHSPKYYEYSALYNKCVAFNLGQDKAEELLCSFCKTLSEYYVTRNIHLLDILILYKREMQNVCKLYESHHLHVYKNILNTHFALFSPVKKEMENDDTIEGMLNETVEIIGSHIDHKTYKYLIPVIDFLYFEYYFQLKLIKNAGGYYEKLIGNSGALLLCSHSSFVFHFLISKIEYAFASQDGKKPYVNTELQSYETSTEDRSSYVLLKYHQASIEFYSNNYPKAIKILNKLLHKFSFIDCLFLEIEIKLFLATLHILNGKPVDAEVLIKSISRKIVEQKEDKEYSIALAFIKLLKIAISPVSRDKYRKILEQHTLLNHLNKGQYRILEFIRLDHSVLKYLAQSGKNITPEKN